MTESHFRPAPGVTARVFTHKDHEVAIPDDPPRTWIFIDGRPVRYGRLGEQYYLDVYAYDLADTLDEVIAGMWTTSTPSTPTREA